MAVKKNSLGIFLLLAVIIGIPGMCRADSFTFSDKCNITITSDYGDVDCSIWQKGSQANHSGIDVATCICANDCPDIPKNHYYYDDPVNKTKQTDDQKITLPVVLAWDHSEGWEKEDGSYVWFWPQWSVGGSDTADSEIFGIRSYLLEIDNTNNDLNESQSAGGIFRRILTTNEFNPESDFYPCFFNSATTYKWRVRPCCDEDGKNCLLEDLTPWWTFTTSAAPEPISVNDVNWNGSDAGGAESVSFDGQQIKWCRVYFQKYKRYATSYKLMVTSDESGSQSCHPLLKAEDECKDEDIYADATTKKVTTLYPLENRSDYAFFTRDHTYVWKMRTCYTDNADDCSDYGQAWTFSTKTDPIGTPEATMPQNDPSGSTPVGLPLILAWSTPDGTNSYIYETTFTNGETKTAWKTVPNNYSPQSEKTAFDADNLAADTEYEWRVRGCSNFDSTNCDDWSEWYSFRTTGRAPKASSLVSSGDIPVTFSWEAVGGAKSYNLSLQKTGGDAEITVLNDEKLLKNPEYTVNYPVIDQGQSYYWKVQTCAHDDGTVCGDWSTENTFTTGALTIPAGKNPAAGDTIYADQLSQELSWSELAGATAYHYTLALTTPADGSSDCQQKTIGGTTKKNSAVVQMDCLGEYTMAVEACVDAQCQSLGPKGEWSFTLDQHVPESKNSFAVCGSGYDNPDTSWNERLTCEPKHLAILIKIFLDFLLFKFSLFLLPFLILVTGFLFYSPFGTPDLIDKVKITWKAIGIGYALLIFAWMITGLILSVVGFQGLWWKIL